eukprot:symbB.v1.2.012708.t2/scaffold882.1/size155402/3
MCKLQHGNKWLNAVVLETLPDSKVRIHVPMDEVPDQELEVTSSKLKPARTEAFELFRHPCYPEGLHRVCFPHGLRGTLFGEPVRCSSDECMPGGCRCTDQADSQETRRIAYFCPRTAFLLCEKCTEVSNLGQVTVVYVLHLWDKTSIAASVILMIDGSVTGSMGEGLIELEVLSMSGECMLTLNVSDSMLGRHLWKTILDKVPCKPGLQLAVSHNSRLVLNESLQQQGLGGERAQVSATYMPVSLLAALRFAHGRKVEDEEFTLNGITKMTGVSDETPALLHNLPETLHKLTFARGQALHDVRLPRDLQSLTFGRQFNQSVDNVTWPAGLQSVSFGRQFNQSVDNVTWPAGLQSLTFDGAFNQSLDNVTWPAGLQSLQSLTFGQYFNQSLDNVTWPAGLQSLTFGPCFDQSVDNVIWPTGLQRLTFGANFNQNLDNVTWPAGLQSLTFGRQFNQSVDNVTWPAGLQSLTFGEDVGADFDQSLDNVTWPADLQSLTFHSIDGRRLAESGAETCRQDLERLKDPDAERCAVAAKRILGLCGKSQEARILFLEAGICTVIAEAAIPVFDTFEGLQSTQDLPPNSQALLKLLTRLAEWLYLAPKRAKSTRVLVNVPENADAFSSAAHLYELFTGRRARDPEEEEEEDWQEAMILEGEQEASSVQVQLLRNGSRISVPQERSMLPRAVPRGDAPKGVRLERHPDVEELLVADADFAPGDLVLRERFLLIGPAELPPLQMFRPVPHDIGTVEIAGEDGFPQSVIFDNEHLKLLFEFMNSELEVQQDVLAMQDTMHPASETFQSTSRVARYLVDQELPWLEGIGFDELSRLLRLFCVNSHPCKTAGNTSGLLKWGTMINHSCLPNVVYSSVASDGYEGHFRACRPIKAGEVLGVSYMKLQAALAPMALRRRMLWYLKGFVCLCCRCQSEAVSADPARALSCGSCGKKMGWQYLPGLGCHDFACLHCGAHASDEETKNEKTLSSAVLGALCARWTGLIQAQNALDDLRTQVSMLHPEHFAVRSLQLLFLALEADEFLSSKRCADLDAAQKWLCGVYHVGCWQEQIRPSQHGGLLMMLSFKSLAPAIRLLSSMCPEEPSDQITTLTLPEALPACVPLPKRANLPSPIVLTQDWLMKHALPRNDLFLAKRVLMDRADLTASDRHGNSVLAVAVEHQCSQEMVELLLERGCPRTSKGPLGPPLAIAARCGRLEVVRVLLDYGCDPSEIEVSKHKLPEAAKNLLGYLVPKDEAVLQKGLPLRRLRRTLAVQTLLPLAPGLCRDDGFGARKMLPSHGQRNLDSQLVQVLVLACEHAAPLPEDSLESLVQLCRSLLMSFDSSSMDLGLRLASCLCEAGRLAAEKLCRHGIFKMLPCLAATPELLHQPPRPQHIRLAAANLLSKWSELISESEPAAPISLAEELSDLTPSELIRLEVPQKLLKERKFQISKELAQMLLQVVEEEEKFSVHVYRERQDVSLRVLTEPFCLFCQSPLVSPQTASKDLVSGGKYVVQAEPLVNMGNLTRLLLVAGGFLGTEDSCLFEPH